MEEKCVIMYLLLSRTKKDMCLKIGASVLIDDNWNYCHEVEFSLYSQQCRDVVKTPILFGIYGWNRRKDPKDYEGLMCCPTWKDVVNVLMK